MIYKLNKKELSKELVNFWKTYYGKIQFILSYMIFFISFTALLVCFLKYCASSYEYGLLYITLYVLVIISLLSIILGSIHYYKEVKDYINSKR